MYINTSSIKNNLQTTSFNLFRKWIENAKKSYTSYDLRISDEGILVNDLKSTIKSSLICLFKREYEDKRLIPGWSIGFIYGYIQSNLNLHWYHEYILKQSDDYKQTISLQAIRNYLESEELVKIQIHHIYKDLLLQDVNLRKMEVNIKKYNVDIEKLKYDISEEYSENIEVVGICLDNLITEKIFNFAKKEVPNLMPEINSYFEDKKIEELIKMNDHT